MIRTQRNVNFLVTISRKYYWSKIISEVSNCFSGIELSRDLSAIPCFHNYFSV